MPPEPPKPPEPPEPLDPPPLLSLRIRSTKDPPKSRKVSTPDVMAVAACCTTSWVTRFTRATEDVLERFLAPPRLLDFLAGRLLDFLRVRLLFALPRFAELPLRADALLPFPRLAELRRFAAPLFFFLALDFFFRADDFFFVAICLSWAIEPAQ
jgi:hypothetical protein